MKRALGTFLLGLLAATLQAAPFAAPNEPVPPFRRAMLPIDADSMSGLSADLTLLSQGSAMESPPQRRATAQGLALAIALDPENSSARGILTEISRGEEPDAPDGEKLGRAKKRIWEVFDWLASPEAGEDGRLLADHLGDAVSQLDPEHPTAVSLRESPERGIWEGWVAPLSSFTEKKPEPEPEPPAPLAETASPEPEKKPDQPSAPPLKTSTASIGTVLSVYDKAADDYVLKYTTVAMEAGPHREGESVEEEGEPVERTGFRIDIPCPGSSAYKVRENVSKPIIAALETLHGSRLPEGKVRLLAGPAGSYSHLRNGNDLTGPGLVLADSAVTGIAPGAAILATLDGKGGLAVPQYFWRKLGTLADGPGGRLIVPAGAEGYFTGMLALEKPELFFKYEVLIASTPAEAIALCAAEPDKDRAAVFAKFAEIREKAGDGAIGSYIANRFVRQRLAEVTEAAPYHLSARLLAIQGAGERPRVLERNILAAEIFEAIDPISKCTNVDVYSVDARTAAFMEKTHDAARDKLDGLERYADMRDRDLIGLGKSLASTLRSLHRLISGRGALWEKYDDIAAAQQELARENRKVRLELSGLTGDELPEDARKRERMRERTLNR